MTTPTHCYAASVLVAAAFAISTVDAQSLGTPAPAPPREAVALMGDALLRVLGDSSRADGDAFIEAQHSPRQSPEEVAAQRRLLGVLLRDGAPFVVQGQQQTASGRILELWSTRAGRGLTLAYAVDRQDPSRLWSLRALRAVDPAAEVRDIAVAGALPGNEASLEAVSAAIHDEVQRLGAVGGFSGQVVVASHGRILANEAVGFVDTLGTRLLPSSLLGQASTPKMLVAISIAQLVEKGRLRWDDTLAALLPALPWDPSARAVSVRQLLTHTAGFGELWDVPGFDATREYARMTEIARLIAPRPIQPVRGFSYSNEGFEILAAIVEAVSGEPYPQYLRDHLLRPAGVARDPGRADSSAMARRAHGLPGSPADPLNLRPRTRQGTLGPYGGTGAGGGYATAEEWALILGALHDGRLVGRELLDSLTQPRVEVQGGAQPSHYGFGMMVDDIGGTRYVGHGGGGPYAGVCNQVRTAVDGSWTVIVLSNLDAPSCQRLLAALLRARPRA